MYQKYNVEREISLFRRQSFHTLRYDNIFRIAGRAAQNGTRQASIPRLRPALDVVLALKRYCTENGCRIVCDRITGLLKNADGTLSGVRSETKKYDGFDAVILCTGGLSYPGTGSTGDGYRLAALVGHRITPPTPSLVGLESDAPLCPAALGLSLRNVEIRVIDAEINKIIYRDFGEMLFCHFGISGPVILSASAHMRPMKSGKYTVMIDLKPALDRETLDRRLLSDFDKFKNRNFANAFDDLLPSKLRAPFVSLCGIPPEKKIHDVTHEQRRKITELLKGFQSESPAFVRSRRQSSQAAVLRYRKSNRRPCVQGSARICILQESSWISTPIPAALICKSHFPRLWRRQMPQPGRYRTHK